MGYNKLVPLIGDVNVPLDNSSSNILEKRNSYILHAEQVAVFSYKGNIQDFKDATIYLNISPCHECTKMLVAIGIKEVVYAEEYHREDMWEMSKILLDKCGIKYRLYVEE